MMFKAIKMDVRLYMFTSSKSIFDAVTTSKSLQKLRSMSDVANIRRTYRVNEFTNVARVCSAQNVADKVTGHVGYDNLANAMCTGRLDFRCFSANYATDDYTCTDLI